MLSVLGQAVLTLAGLLAWPSQKAWNSLSKASRSYSPMTKHKAAAQWLIAQDPIRLAGQPARKLFAAFNVTANAYFASAVCDHAILLEAVSGSCQATQFSMQGHID